MLEREGVVALVASERTVEVVLQRGDLGSSSVGEVKSISFSVSISLVVEGVLEFSRDIFWGVMLRRLALEDFLFRGLEGVLVRLLESWGVFVDARIPDWFTEE